MTHDGQDENPIIAGWRSIPPLGRDLLVAVIVIVVLLGSLWAYTGQPVGSAPLVVVESGSMMHPDAPYGRLGTIDPGDLILVRNVDAETAKRDVVTKYGAIADGDHPGTGKREGYGHPGDVIIFSQDECRGVGNPPIIHRALTWVEVHQDGKYSYHDENGVWQVRRDQVDLEEARLEKDTFQSSGWVTQGDNPNTNRQADQAGICKDLLVEPDWLVGKARGEIPWLGLLKFMLAGNSVSPNPEWCTVVQAHAPCDLFTMLWITVGVIIAIPLAWDLSSRFLRNRDDEDEGGGGDPGVEDDDGFQVHKGPKVSPPDEQAPPWAEEEPRQDEDEDGDEADDGIRKMGP